MKIIDKLLDAALGRALARRYLIGVNPPIVYMDASQPITAADVAIMQAIAAKIPASGAYE